ncbi:hypothetical protein F8A86_05090 [Betaproteobacteria bacterium SCN1]|jgi:phosphoribosylformimino-5-aminoimidazole carboxamide ribotide isomerase|nr:hypothetical protein F8A86_05090 [Betaproteobacteria bacterium SCN1]
MTSRLNLIPVLDLMNGQVVRARAGRRADYRPLHSALCEGSVPETVVGGLLELYPFERLYVADLDAIQGRGDHGDVLACLCRAHPALELWVDAGFADPAAAAAWQARGVGRPVLGSESLARGPVRGDYPPGAILSLDFRDTGFVGPAGLAEAAGDWPDDVIVMSLPRVGMGGGPDWARLAGARRLAPGCRLHAAGGVRDAADLAALADAGVAGVLLASALHEGVLNRKALDDFHGAHPRHAATGARANGPAPGR